LVIAGLVGNILEWYDFSVYGYFAVSIGRHFFPSQYPTTSLLAAFGVFAAGFLMRPAGAVLFGHIGDNWSREKALSLSVLAMAVPTFLIGVLPDYQQIGVTASVLLVLLRLAQAFRSVVNIPLRSSSSLKRAFPSVVGSWRHGACSEPAPEHYWAPRSALCSPAF